MFNIKRDGLCPSCEKGQLREAKKDLLFTYKDRSKKLAVEKILICSLCKYESFTKSDNDRIERILADFRRGVDGLLSCEELQKIREKLGLNKKMIARILSVNEKTIGRYENGKVKQSEQVDKLYRILRAMPSAISIIDPAFSSEIHGNKPEHIIKTSYNSRPANPYIFQKRKQADDYYTGEEMNNVA